MAVLFSTALTSKAEVVVDAQTQVVYEIIEGTQTVEISNTQSLNSFYGTLYIPKTVTDENAESKNYGQTYTVVAMQQAAFRYCPMEAAVIEAEIPEIPTEAFYYCTNLKSITLPETIKVIGVSSFSNCYNLTSIAGGPSLTTIGNYAFSSCSKLEEIDLSKSTKLSSIGMQAFNYCNVLKFPEFPMLESEYIDFWNYCFAYCKNLGDVVIPENVRLHTGAFNNSTLTGLTFPEAEGWMFGPKVSGDNYGGKSVFSYATLPDEIIFPSSTPDIPDEAFYHVYNVKNAIFKDNPDLNIGSKAFQSSSIATLEFEGGVSEIGAYAFHSMRLEEVNLPPCDRLGDSCFANNYLLAQITFPDTPITYYDDPTKAGTGIFSQSNNLTEVSLPEWSTTVPPAMFSTCPNLTSVDFPSKLEVICHDAFASTKLNIADSPLPNTLKEIQYNAFANVTTLKELTLPASLEKIGQEAFKECSLLTLPNFEELTALTEIGAGAFSSCVSLESIVLPPNLKNLGDVTSESKVYDIVTKGAFQNCSKLKSVKFNNGVIVGINCFYNTPIETIEWPEEDMQLRHGSFRSCTKLTGVTIPGYVKTIPSEAFYLCTGIAGIALKDGVETIGPRAFMNCSALELINFGNTVKYINPGAFAFTRAYLQSLPSSVESIGGFAFWHANCGPAFTISESVKTIGENAFCANNISRLYLPEYPDYDPEKAEQGILPIGFGPNVFSNNVIESIELPWWMKRVPTGFLRQETRWDAYRMSDGIWHWPRSNSDMNDYADHRDVLRKVVFAPGTYSIEQYAFANNRMLSIDEFPSTIRTYGKNCFIDGGSSLTTETVIDEDGNPTEQEMYLGTVIAADDCTFEDASFSNAKIKGIIFQGCARFGDGALAGMKYIKEIEFPECMTVIPDGFCKEWAILENVKFKNNKIEKIGKGAFEKCKLLQSIPDLGKNTALTTIEATAFAECPNFSGELDLSGLTNLSVIGERAFAQSPVTSIKWPTSEEISLQARAFHQCELTSVTIPKNMYNVGLGCFAKNPIKEILFEERDKPERYLNIGELNFHDNDLITKVNFPDCNLSLGRASFKGCDNLEEVTWPASEERTVTLGRSAFMSDHKLKIDHTHPGTRELSDSVFADNQAIINIDLPGVNHIGTSAFNYCRNLETVAIHGYLNEIGEMSFYYCDNLEKISMRVAPSNIKARAFWACVKLEEFEVEDTDFRKVKGVYNDAFKNCKSLKSFPDIFDPTGSIYTGAFFLCCSLRSLKIPAMFNNWNVNGNQFNSTHWRLYHCENLQSIEFTRNHEDYYPDIIQLYPDDFNTPLVLPLKGISYMRGELKASTIQTFRKFAGNGPLNRTEPIKMLVSRGNKYKLVEKNYEYPLVGGTPYAYKFFDIREIKEPKLELHGEIFSTFDLGNDINQYTGVIRWRVELSDLDEVNPTHYELWRDGKKVAYFVFNPPVLEDEGVTDGSVETHEPTYSVAYRAYDADGNDVTESLHYGDFYFEISPNRFTYTLQTAQDNVYFSGSTTARIGQAEKLGRESWFLYKDRFDSPRLDSYGVPVSHTYVLKMKNYDYQEWENNEGYLQGEDGEYFHFASKRTGKPGEEWMESEPCMVYTSIAHPSIGIDGLYSREQVEADINRELDVTTVPENATYALTYHVAGGAVDHINHDKGTHVVESVQAYRLGERGEVVTTETEPWGDLKDVKGVASGVITGPEDNIIPGKTTFQTITNADYRGTFGSPKVTILGAPGLAITAELDNSIPEHRHEFWSEARRYQVNLGPILEAFGYGEDLDLTSDKYFIGLWRTQKNETLDGYRAASHADENDENSAEDEGEETLVWHSNGAHLEDFQHSCEICSQVGYDPETMVYTDHVLHPNVTKSTVSYTARLYVQKPDDPNKYGVAEAVSDPIETLTLTGLDIPEDDLNGAELSEILSRGELFNVNGMRISQPAAGSVFIALLDGKIYKLRMP